MSVQYFLHVGKQGEVVVAKYSSDAKYPNEVYVIRKDRTGLNRARKGHGDDPEISWICDCPSQQVPCKHVRMMCEWFSLDDAFGAFWDEQEGWMRHPFLYPAKAIEALTGE